MNIRTAVKSDLKFIAQLHSDSISTGFLSKLGIPFLTELYGAISKESRSCLLVAEIDNKIAGFIAGTVDIQDLYKKILIKNWFKFVFPLIIYLLKFKFLKKILETAIYGLKKDKNNLKPLCSAELLSISINESFRGRGIGKKLISELELFFRIKNVTEYKVVTFSEDRNSNSFYKTCNFKFNRQFIHHNNTMNEYIKSYKQYSSSEGMIG